MGSTRNRTSRTTTGPSAWTNMNDVRGTHSVWRWGSGVRAHGRVPVRVRYPCTCPPRRGVAGGSLSTVACRFPMLCPPRLPRQQRASADCMPWWHAVAFDAAVLLLPCGTRYIKVHSNGSAYKSPDGCVRLHAPSYCLQNPGQHLRPCCCVRVSAYSRPLGLVTHARAF